MFALGPPGRASDAPGWRVRVVPNKYPAVAGEDGRNEVVIHSPRHVTSLADLDSGEIREVALAWRERARAARELGFPYVHALLNEGAPAGGSLPHTHSQLVWLSGVPPVVADEDASALRAMVEMEVAGGERVVGREDGVVAFCPAAGRAPYEVLVAPTSPEEHAFESALLPAALELLADSIRRLHTVEERVPLNAWLHTGSHWHLELVPRLTIAAGLELGAGVYVNPLPPEEAALRLRSAVV